MAGLALSDDDRDKLQRWIDDPATPSRLRLRAGIVLALAAGLSDREVARRQAVARQTVALWRQRVTEHRTALAITADAPGRGRKPSVPAALRDAVCGAYRAAALGGCPRSVRDLAREFSLSPATVHRTLRLGLSDYSPHPAAPAARRRVTKPRGARGADERSSPAA